MQENSLILLYNSSTAKKHLLNLLYTPSRPRACKTVHKGKVGNLLDSESAINPETSDRVVSLGVGLPPLISANLYNVYKRILRKIEAIISRRNICKRTL